VHVVLVGLMGAGKTTAGRRAAKELRRPFVDTDEAFIPRYGRTVAEVVAGEGEQAFRDKECETLAELLAVASPLVIATGGGIVVRPENRERLAGDEVFVVYLHAKPAFLASRTSAKPDRYLLAGADPFEVLSDLYAQRDPWYREVADAVIEVADLAEWGSRPRAAIAARIAGLVRDLAA
jgi:shikimate kinase